MIIHLTKSRLFTVDPAQRFASKHRVKQKVFHELYRRFGLQNHDMAALCGYFLYKTNKRVEIDTMQMWMLKTDIYGRAQHAIAMGVRVVDSSFFNENEAFVLKEITRHLRNGEAKENRTMV